MPYTARLLNLRALEHRAPAYLALNPAGKVPTLVDSTSTTVRVINQANAIIQFADAWAPGRLAPAQPGPGRDKVFDRYFYFVTDVIAPGHAAFFLRKTGLGDAAAVIDLRAFSADPRCKSISTPWIRLVERHSTRFIGSPYSGE